MVIINNYQKFVGKIIVLILIFHFLFISANNGTGNLPENSLIVELKRTHNNYIIIIVECTYCKSSVSIRASDLMNKNILDV